MSTPSVPGTLSVGTHLSPDQGACLMEAVAAAAGEPWSDTPACTHPLLAHLARLVNDAMSDASRDRLRELVPLLLRARDDAPRSYPQLAHACTTYALTLRTSPLLVHLHHVAAAQLARERDGAADTRTRWLPSLPARLYRRGPAFRGVESAAMACARLPVERRDEALHELLVRAIEVVLPDAMDRDSAPMRADFPGGAQARRRSRAVESRGPRSVQDEGSSRGQEPATCGG